MTSSIKQRLRFLLPARNHLELFSDQLLQKTPSLHSQFHCHFGRGTGVAADTGIVIEGYQSAANSFVREAFRRVNPEVSIASHMHSVAPLILAKQRGIPAMVLLREPVSSIISLKARFITPDFDSELRRYIHFYRQLPQVQDYALLVSFDEATSDLGGITERINQRFGASFVPFHDDDNDLQSVVRLTIDSYTATVFGTNDDVHTAMPSEARKVVAAQLRTDLTAPRYASRVARATALFENAMAAKARQDGAPLSA